jgi:hypothetical protein
MSKIGTAFYMTLGILIAFLIFTSMIKTAIFSSTWFNPEKSVLPVIFYASLVDFFVLIVLFSILNNVRLYAGAFNDDITFVSGIAGLLLGWMIILAIRIPIALLPNSVIPHDHIFVKSSWETILMVCLTLGMIVASREILLRGFIFQYLSRGIGEMIPTYVIPLFYAIFCGRFEHYSLVEFLNLFLFNVILCYSFRLFHDLWLSSAISFAIYLSSYFSHLPIRELAYIDISNRFSGFSSIWVGNEVTIFAGIPMTAVLVFLVYVFHNLVKNKRALPIRDESLEYGESIARRPRRNGGYERQNWIG